MILSNRCLRSARTWATVLLAACASGAQQQEVEPEPTESLAGLGRARGVLIGTMARSPHLVQPDDPRYAETLATEFSVLTAPCYFSTVQRTPGRFAFNRCDALYDFAQQHGLAVRGHTLVWSNALPSWLEDLTVDSLWAAARHHVVEVVSRYRGRTLAWDVVNEAVSPAEQVVAGAAYRRPSLWYRRLGPTVYDSAFHWARRADAEVGLFYNDHSIEVSAEWGETIYRMVEGLKRRGAPITGVGLQFHLTVDQVLDTARIASDFRRLAALDLDIHITELDVLIGRSPATEDELARQAELYRTVMRMCLSVSRCNAFMMWGFTDRHQSRSSVTWEDDPLIFDREYRVKPAYVALREELRGRLER